MGNTIKKHELIAVSKFAAKEMGRFAINGVMLNGKDGLIGATDGRRIVMHRLAEGNGDEKSHILSQEAIRMAKVFRAPVLELRVEERNGRVVSVLAEKNGQEAACGVIEGEFPKWRQIFSGLKSNVRLSLSARLLRGLCEFAEAVDPDATIQLHLPVDPASLAPDQEQHIMRGVGFSCNGGDSLGVLMPKTAPNSDEKETFDSMLKRLCNPKSTLKSIDDADPRVPVSRSASEWPSENI